jgi:integrase
MLLDHAVVKKYLRTNPLKDALGKRNKKHLPTPGIEIATNFLSLGELLTLAKECGYYRDVVLVLGLCGLRWGELVGLKAKDLDLQKGTLTIRGALVEVDGRLSESTTKANRWRIVRLPEILRESCGEWIKGKNENDPLFHTETGNFIRNTNFTRRVFLPAIERAGVKKIRIHDLRHTAASIAISAKATPNMVKELLGHADVQLTMRVYAHVFEEDRETVATNIDRAVNEVHEMCTEDLAGIISPPRKATNARSEQDFSFNIHTLDSLRTWDYEFGALTN